MTEVVAVPTHVLQSHGKVSYRVTVMFIAMTISGINIFTDPSRFADFDTYVYYLDSLVHFPSQNTIYFEFFSNIYLLLSHWLTRSVLSGIILAHYVLGGIFIFALVRTFPPQWSTWPALLFLFATFGPLLAFVTLRATPAYFLVAAAVRYAIERRRRAWVLMFAASLFHISALLALAPLAMVYFERNLPWVLRSDLPRKFYLVVVVIILGLAAILPQLPSVVTDVIQSIPVIAKYSVYVDVAPTETQIGHYVFLVFSSFLTLVFFITQEGKARRMNVYILTSFLLYLTMFFSASPVAAFRQAPFWIMPMIAVLPWQRLGVKAVVAPLFVVACGGLFYFQFQQLYM